MKSSLIKLTAIGVLIAMMVPVQAMALTDVDDSVNEPAAEDFAMEMETDENLDAIVDEALVEEEESEEILLPRVQESGEVERNGASVATLKLAKPVVRTSISGDGIRVSWDKVENAKSYRVYRAYSVTGEMKLIKETRELTYRDSKCRSGKRVYYCVRAVNGDVKSSLSDIKGNRIYRVFIEAGHGIDSEGKWDPGCRWNGYQEAKLVTPIAKSMTYYMRKSHVYVYTDSYSGNDTNLFWAIAFIKKHNVSAFVNIHCDYSKAKPGTLPLYRTAEQKKLAIALNKGVHSTVSIKDRGLSRRTDLASLNPAKVSVPSCIFETGAIKADNTLLRTKYKTYGKGLAKGLCSYLGIPFVE